MKFVNEQRLFDSPLIQVCIVLIVVDFKELCISFVNVKRPKKFQRAMR
jgi:hypothetical protein